MTSDDLGNFLTHVTTFHDLRMTLMTHGDDILMTLKAHGEVTLMTRMTSGEDTLMTPVMNRDYHVTTPHDITDDPCDNIDDLGRKAYGGGPAIPIGNSSRLANEVAEEWQRAASGDGKTYYSKNIDVGN